jgi:hypothetical protein
MRKLMTFGGVLGALAVPAAAQASGTASRADRQNASRECRFKLGATAATREAFTTKYGTHGNGKNAFGRCVSKLAKTLESDA